MIADEERMEASAASRTVDKSTAERMRLAWIEEEENG